MKSSSRIEASSWGSSIPAISLLPSSTDTDEASARRARVRATCHRACGLGGDAEEHGSGMENARRIDVRGDTHQTSVEQPLAAAGDGTLRQIDHGGRSPPRTHGRSPAGPRRRSDRSRRPSHRSRALALLHRGRTRWKVIPVRGRLPVRDFAEGGRHAARGAETTACHRRHPSRCAASAGARRRRRRDRSLGGALVDGCLCYSASASACWRRRRIANRPRPAASRTTAAITYGALSAPVVARSPPVDPPVLVPGVVLPPPAAR